MTHGRGDDALRVYRPAVRRDGVEVIPVGLAPVTEAGAGRAVARTLRAQAQEDFDLVGVTSNGDPVYRVDLGDGIRALTWVITGQDLKPWALRNWPQGFPTP